MALPLAQTLARTDAHISNALFHRVSRLASSLILHREVHCAVQPGTVCTEQACSTAGQRNVAAIWPWLHAAAAAGLASRQPHTALPAFGAFHAVVAAAADACRDGAAAEAATAQLLQLVQQQAASTATHSQQQQQEQDKQLLLALQQLAGAALPPQQLLQLLNASCKLQQTPSQLLGLLTHSVVQALPQLAPMQLADALSALATCHSSCRPPAKQLLKRAALTKAVSRYLQRQQHAFDAASTAAVAAALARDTYTTSSSSSSSSNSSSNFTLLSMLMMDHLQQMSPQQLAEALAACAAAQHYNQAVVDAAVQAAVRLLRQQGFRLQQQQQQQDGEEGEGAPGQLQANMDGVQQGQQCGSAPAAAASSKQGTDGNSLQQQQQQQGKAGFSPTNLAQLLQACCTLRHHSADLLECAATATLRSLHATQLHQVVAVVAACAELNHYNMSLFQVACRLAQEAMAGEGRRQLQQHSDSSSSSSSGATSSSSVGPGVCEHRSPTDSSSSSGSSSGGGGSGSSSSNSLASVLTQLAWSCAVMNHFEPGFFKALASWSAKLQVEHLSQQQLLQWFQVQFCLSDAAVQLPELRSIGLSNQLLLAAHAAWLQALTGQQRLTSFHKEVHQALQQAGRRSRLNVALDGPLVVDVALARMPNSMRKEQVAIQLETPDMFAANPPHAALGPTAARWRALQARGWQVLSLRYCDWCRLKTPEEQARYMWHIKEASTVRTPLAPDVMRVGGQQQDTSKAPKSLTQQLWRLLVD